MKSKIVALTLGLLFAVATIVASSQTFAGGSGGGSGEQLRISPCTG